MSDVLAGITDIVRTTFDDPSLAVTPQTRAADVTGWDSVAMVEIIMAVEERFGVRFGSRDMDRIGCVGDMVGLIEEKTGK